MPVTANFTQRLFHEYFPPPRFLEMPAVGLTISDDAVSAIELVRRRDAYAVGRFGRRPLLKESIMGGYVNDKDAVVGELRKLKNELKLDFVNASLSEEKAYLFQTSIPKVSYKEIRSALEFKLEENVPIPAQEAVFDYTILEGVGHGNEDHLDIGVTVLPKKVVETYTELLETVGLLPLSFEIEAQAISRAVIRKGDRGTYLLVNFGENKTGLFIVSGEVVRFTSTVAIGGEYITKAIAKFLSVSAEEAVRIKHAQAAVADKKNMDLFLSLMNALSALKDEINKLSIYWHTHKSEGGESGPRITKMILCGRDAAFPGFADFLSPVLQNGVEVGNVWSNTSSLDEYIPPIPFGESLDYAAAVGVALPKGH